MKLATKLFLALSVCSCLLAAESLPAKRAAAPLPPGFSPNPASLSYGDVNTGSNKMDSVVITNTGTSSLIILNVTSTNTEYTVTPKTGNIAAAASKTFYITFTPISAGAKNGGIVFQSNMTPSRDTIPVTGNGVGATLAPLFSVAPASVALGDVATGSTKTDSVFVTNTGTLSLSITSVTVTSGFTISPTNATLAPAATRKFTLNYAPLIPGAKSGFIYFNHNAASKRDSVPVSATAVGDTIQPKFAVSPGSIDFGDVATGTPKTDSIFVTNTGKMNLSISSVTSSSTRVTIAPGAATIAPAESFKFTVTFTPSAPGVLSGRLTFNHNAGARKDSVLFTGNGVGDPIAPKFSANPSDSIAFGDVSPGGSKQDSIIVSNTGTATLNITSTSSSNPRFTITGGGGPGGGSIAPGASRKYTVTFSPTTTGRQTGTIFFNNNAASKKDSVHVSGNGAGPALAPVFTASVKSLDFGDVVNGQTKKDSVSVTNTGTATLTISQVASDNARYTVTPGNGSLQPNASRTFVITFAPQIAGPNPARLVFTNNSATRRDTVLLTGNGTGPDIAPKFTAAPALLDFDTVSTGTTRVDSITVTNAGTLGLTVNNVSSTNPRFTVTPRNANIPVAGQAQFRVTFAPTAPGPQHGWIRFPHNGATPMDSVEVTGIGTGMAIEPVFSAPPSLAFGLVDTGKALTDSIKVTNTGTQTLTIPNVTSTSPMFTVTPRNNVSIAAGAFRMFAVTFRPTVLGSQSAYLVFMNNSATSPDSVLLTGTGSTATLTPNFTVAPKSLRFGYVETPKSKTDSVIVTNTGRQQLVISDVSSDNDQFVVTPKSAAIEGASSVTFRITFTPAGPNKAQGSIVFAHNGPSVNDTVGVLGNDIVPTLITTARSQPNGTEVIVEGIVTRARGNNLRMQDGTAGLTVRQGSGAFHDAIASGFVKAGDQLRVWGRVSEVTGLKQISQADIFGFERLSRDHILPDPTQLTLTEVALGGEQYESMLIRVVDLTITAGSDTAFVANKAYQIADPSDNSNAVALRIPAGTDTEVAGMRIPAKAVFTGVLGQVTPANPSIGYQLIPVLPGDIAPAGTTGVDDRAPLPASAQLIGSFPNPFEGATTLSYALATESRVSLRVYSALGQEIATLVDERQATGRYSSRWNGTDAKGSRVPAGVYLCRFTAEDESGAVVSRTATLVLMK